MVNIDGFVLTHSYEQVIIPTKEQIKKYLPKYNPKPGQFLDPKNPLTMGSFATPAHYMEIREDLHNDLLDSQKNIKEEYEKYLKTIKLDRITEKRSIINNGLVEYYGNKKAKTVLIAMGSVIGTLKDVADNDQSIAILKIKHTDLFLKRSIKYIKKVKMLL